MIFYILTKNGKAYRKIHPRLSNMGFKYSVEKLDIGKYIFAITDPDMDKWKYLRDMIGNDDYVFNDSQN